MSVGRRLMQKERWQKLEAIFASASEVHGAERDEMLRVTCHDDEAMCSEIGALLEEHDNLSTSLDTSVFDIGLQILDGNSADKRIGETLGHFIFGRLIGRGGMGEIYAAEDTKLGRKVAIKLVNELFALDPERIRRFRKEAKAASRVSHRNVAKLYELCEIDGENLIVMEFVDGINLRKHLASSISLGKALDIAIQISLGLAAAHAVGVVHRDIKPENIIITPDGTVKVLDFGLAKLVKPIGDGTIQISGHERVELTVDMSTELGILIGTPAYMSPEQIRGAEVDTQTDIWSLGVLLYEMLTGELPFPGATKIDSIAATLLSRHSPVQMANSAGLDKINVVLRKALNKEKTSRYQDIGELLIDLQTLKNSLEARSVERHSRYPFGLHGAWRYVAGAVLLATLLIAVLPASRRWAASFLFAQPPSGLVGHWPGDGNSNDVVAGNNGILLNNVAFAPGYADQAFSLDGVNGYVEVPDSAFLSITGPMTLQASIKIDANAVPQSIIEKYDEPGINGYLLRLEGGKLLATICDHKGCSRLSGATTVSVGTWHRVSAVYDGTSIKLYLDGILDGAIPTDLIPTDGSTSLKIGARGDDAKTRFSGLIDEVKIYNRALSPVEILPNNGLVSYWPGDGNVNDVVGGNSGELLNGATYRPGVSGQAFSFDGIDDFLQTPTKGLPTGSGDRTMAMWVTIDNFQTMTAVFGGYGAFGSDSQVYFLQTLGANLSITNWGEGSGITPLEPGKWYHIAATTDSNSTSLYLNGNLLKKQNMTLDTPVNTHFYSGRLPGKLGDIRRLKGAVDEIQIYNRGLSASEIQTLFLAYKPSDE